jgi:hypothetical protein
VSLPEWSVRVRAATRNEAHIHAGKHKLSAGHSVTLGDANRHPSALDLFLGSAAADLCNGFSYVAGKRRILLDSLEVLARCRLENPLVALGVVGEEGSPAVKHLELTLFVASDAESEDLESVWKETLQRAPVISTLCKLSEISVSWRQV